MYRLTERGWEGFTPIPTWRRMWHFQAKPEVLKADQLPQEVEKATVYVHSDIIMVTGHAAIDTKQAEDNQDFWVTWQCEYSLEGDAKVLKQAIEEGKVVAVSNGSFQCGARAAAWTIEGTMVEN